MSGFATTSPNTAAETASESYSSPFRDVQRAVDAVDALCGRVAALAHRLVGLVPEKSPVGAEAISPGVFGAVSASTTAVLRDVASMNEALSRIERELP